MRPVNASSLVTVLPPVVPWCGLRLRCTVADAACNRLREYTTRPSRQSPRGASPQRLAVSPARGSGNLDEHLPDRVLAHGLVRSVDLLQREADRRQRAERPTAER